jgi:hypothetical protein
MSSPPRRLTDGGAVVGLAAFVCAAPIGSSWAWAGADMKTAADVRAVTAPSPKARHRPQRQLREFSRGVSTRRFNQPVKADAGI